MQTDRIQIQDYREGREKALREAEKYSAYMEYERKTALRVRLMVEETFGMVCAITGEYQGEFWMESGKDGVCLIHLLLRTDMDPAKKRELIGVSKNRKNAAYPGIMGKIRELFEDSIYYGMDEEAVLVAQSMSGYTMLGMADVAMVPGAPIVMTDYTWTLENYRQGVSEARQKGHGEADEAWDELEKSVIANLADDVRVSVKGNTAELIIEKRFPS